MIDDILSQAEQIAAQASPDDAARFLASYRKDACESLQNTPSAMADLLAITSAQMQFLIDAGASDKALGIAEWFLHTLHHYEETIDHGDFIKLKRALRESFSRFFRRYARVLRDADCLEDEPAGEWFLKRCAEALAGLDFSGLHDTPFRNALDEFQFAMRSAENFIAAQEKIQILCSENPEDLSLKTLANLLDSLA